MVTGSAAQLRLQTGGEMRIEREPGLVVFRMRRPLSESELIHPYLAPVAAVAAYWFDRESFHAGAFVVDSGAWGVVGEREAGKSTLLASLAPRGITILTDDMLILDGNVPFPAPRSIDLRPAAAQHFGVGEPLGIMGSSVQSHRSPFGRPRRRDRRYRWLSSRANRLKVESAERFRGELDE